MAGPLAGVKVVEMNAIGPAPLVVMMLADMGAEVIRGDRQVANFLSADGSVLGRGRRSIAIDPRRPGATEVLLKLLEGTDACFAPVLDFSEAPYHLHNRAREVFIEIDGGLYPAPAPAPAPRLSRKLLQAGRRASRHPSSQGRRRTRHHFHQQDGPASGTKAARMNMGNPLPMCRNNRYLSALAGHFAQAILRP